MKTLIDCLMTYKGTRLSDDPLSLDIDYPWTAEVLLNRGRSIETMDFKGKTQIDAESKARLFIKCVEYQRVLLEVGGMVSGLSEPLKSDILEKIESVLSTDNEN